MTEWHHKPVMMAPVLTGLAINPQGIYVDATFGRGGHSRQILDQLGPSGRVLAFDKDPAAVAVGRQMAVTDPRLQVFHGSFTQLVSTLEAQRLVGKIHGILMDLGVSSPQLDDPERGFSFQQDGPLDMRMDTSQGVDAATWLGKAKEADIATVLKEYGEERFARRIARAIVKARCERAITTTAQLATIVKEANPNWERHKHPATRSFQGIRIFINRELDDLQMVLPQCLTALVARGRLVVISFHSLEDRIVKRFMQRYSKGQPLPKGLPIKDEALDIQLKIITKNQKATIDEIEQNPRARSAVLRVGEKL